MLVGGDVCSDVWVMKSAERRVAILLAIGHKVGFHVPIWWKLDPSGAFWILAIMFASECYNRAGALAVTHSTLVQSYLWGMNLAASSPNIGRPIWVSDSLIDFFLRKTFSPAPDTTLNSILPEKVAVRDLKWKVCITRRECQYWNDLETSSRSMETCSSSSQSFPLGYKHSCHSRSMPWADTKNLSDSMYSPETMEKEHWLFDNREPSHH